MMRAALLLTDDTDYQIVTDQCLTSEFMLQLQSNLITVIAEDEKMIREESYKRKSDGKLLSYFTFN